MQQYNTYGNNDQYQQYGYMRNQPAYDPYNQQRNAYGQSVNGFQRDPRFNFASSAAPASALALCTAAGLAVLRAVVA